MPAYTYFLVSLIPNSFILPTVVLLQAIDRFRANDHGILVATDVAARGLDIPGVRSVIHYQLPHSAEVSQKWEALPSFLEVEELMLINLWCQVYVHRSGRTARASSDGCSIALISSRDTSKFASLCKSFSKVTKIEYLSFVALEFIFLNNIHKYMYIYIIFVINQKRVRVLLWGLLGTLFQKKSECC